MMDPNPLGSTTEAEHSEKVLQEFERAPEYAESYTADTTDGHFYRVRLERVSELLRGIEGRIALDIGTGPGFGLALLRRRGFLPIGIDVSLPMLRVARRTLDRVSLVRATAESLPFSTGTFDVVLCLGVLEYVWELDTAFAEVRRVLRPGGCFVASMLNPWSPHRVIQLRVLPGLRRVLHVAGASTTLHNTPSRAELRRRLQEAGLQTLEMTFFDFNLFPPPFDSRYRSALSIARRLEGRGRSVLGPLATAMLVKCT
jgi:SAM-dependent methyltransferase